MGSLLKSPFVWLGALWIGVMIHLDWHLGRPGHDHLSLGFPYHWIAALPVFAPLAWLTLRRFGRAAVPAGAAMLVIGIGLGQILEPLAEGPASLGNVVRWWTFAEFIAAGLVSYLLGLALAARSLSTTPP